jgi:hypothetical protein
MPEPESNLKLPEMKPVADWGGFWRGVAGLAVLTLAMFGDLLFTKGDRMLSSEGLDLAKQFVHWRTFGFGELRHGHLALWNPHIFSGAPFFGGFQSALLYPPNLVFLALPLAQAVNWSIALHVFLSGVFTLAWAFRRGLQPSACFLSSATFMFCGAHFLHIYAGHLPNLCTLAWAPLILLTIDALAAGPTLRWVLVGTGAVAMQILAGHPQYVFYTAIAVGGYTLLSLRTAARRSWFALSLLAMLAGAVALTAIQTFTAVQESSEMLRSGGLDYETAASFSFPPENLLTVFAPHFFGDMTKLPYWGSGYLWEMSLFVGVVAFTLAIGGAVYTEKRLRRFSVTMAVGLLILALGAHTPLFTVLYRWFPGFDKFRGTSKFVFLASLFLSLLAGMGLDVIIRRQRAPGALIAGSLAMGVLLGTAGLWMKPSSGSPAAATAFWERTLNRTASSQEIYLPQKLYTDPEFIAKAGKEGSSSVLIAGGTFLILGLLLALRAKARVMPALIVTLAVLELFAFARGARQTMRLDPKRNETISEHLARNRGDYRIINLVEPNAAMSLGAQDLWGDDPGVLKRYAELLAFTQGVDPGHPVQFLPIQHDSRMYAMLRRRFTIAPREPGGSRVMIFSNTNALPRLQLVYSYVVLTNRDEIFAALSDPAFNPRQKVVLETTPTPAPAPVQKHERDSVELIDSSTDHLTIRAEVASPALLLITDAYSRNWVVHALMAGPQQAYPMMPANYCLRAVPLAAGKHLFRMEYRPSGFVAGRWVSLVGLAAYVGTVAFWLGRQRGSGGGRVRAQAEAGAPRAL